MRSLTALPKIEIILGNQIFRKEDLKFLGSMRVLQKLSHPTLCELVFTNIEDDFPDVYPCKKGTNLVLSIAGEAMPLFTGIITAIEYHYEPTGGLSLSVRGYDKLYLSGKSQRIHTHIQTTIPDIAKEMMKDYGIDIAQSVTGPVWEQLVQYRESDLDFLVRTAQRSGLYFIINRQNKLEIMSLEGNGRDIYLKRGDTLFELTVEINEAPVLDSVYSCGWDPSLAEFHDGKASSKNQGQARKLVDIPVRNNMEAETVSQAELDRCSYSETTVRGVTEGNSSLIPGANIHIEGIHYQLKRSYVLTEVDHTFTTSSGYISEFCTMPPDFRTPDTGTNASFGIVSDINDPENLGRIKASLPSFENSETDWMNVLMPAAGNNKGAVMLPDTGDQVLILFLNNDPARGVVIGGVFGASQQPSDWGIEDNQVKRFCFLTPQGQKISLDDKTLGIRVENNEGSFFEIYPDTVKLYSMTDLKIEAPGKNITIMGKKINFKKG